MKTLIPLCLCMALLISCNTGAPKNESTEAEEWIQLFNGSDLEGWTIKMNKHALNENFNNTFRWRTG